MLYVETCPKLLKRHTSVESSNQSQQIFAWMVWTKFTGLLVWTLLRYSFDNLNRFLIKIWFELISNIRSIGSLEPSKHALIMKVYNESDSNWTEIVWLKNLNNNGTCLLRLTIWSVWIFLRIRFTYLKAAEQFRVDRLLLTKQEFQRLFKRLFRPINLLPLSFSFGIALSRLQRETIFLSHKSKKSTHYCLTIMLIWH